MTDQDSAISFQNQGDHHLAKVSFDPNSGQISAGAIENFSNNTSAGIQFVDGKAEGTIVHTSDNHSLTINAKQDGSFDGEYYDAQSNLRIFFNSGLASIVSGTLPPSGLNIQSTDHALTLSTGPDGKLMGSIESQAGNNGEFKLAVNGGNVTGTYSLMGDNHQINVSLSSNGTWSAGMDFGQGNTKFSLNVSDGKGQATVFGGIKLKF
jgi:hypothetical protein